MSDQRGKLVQRWGCSCDGCTLDWTAPVSTWTQDDARRQLGLLGWKQNPFTLRWFCAICVRNKVDRLAR